MDDILYCTVFQEVGLLSELIIFMLVLIDYIIFLL